MQQLIRTAEKVSQTKAAVLITGESGTGKEVVARAIHHFSRRAAGPWVDINCAALPEHLIESELFGFEKGAFSGADSSKPGMFELAHGGTLFLDEIGELGPSLQTKLLRVLDGNAFYRLGSTRKVAVDARLVAATNVDPQEAIAAGKLRRDLFHRLSMVHLHVPPLRERPADIVTLATHFLALQDESLRFAPETLDLLEKHAWPGNVRELRNVVVTAAIFAEGTEVKPQDLPPQFALYLASAPTLEGRLNGVERDAVLRALGETGGRQDQAAKLLGISRRTLLRKLKVYRSAGGGELMCAAARRCL
jgi:DNA-binding NtrC family response regulator